MPRRHSAPLPDFIPPQLARLADSAAEGDAWLHEVKIDGYRVAAGIARGKVRMFTRHANDWTPRFRPIAAILAELPVKAAYLDGEVAVLTAEGVSDFGALQETLGRRGRSRELAFIAFDLLHLDGRDLRRLPLVEGRRSWRRSSPDCRYGASFSSPRTSAARGRSSSGSPVSATLRG